jgi:proline racemase
MAFGDFFQSWVPPPSWERIETIDAHAAGEPLRIVIGGFPALQGHTILERRLYARTHLDHLRKALMWEPRGHKEMYGCIITPPVSPGANFGVLFTHNEGYSTMCGHGIIAVSTVAVEIGLVPRSEPETNLAIDTPAGLVRCSVTVEQGRCVSSRFENVPSYAVSLDASVHLPGVGSVSYDLAFGGAFYAFVKADAVGLRCDVRDLDRLASRATTLKRLISQTVSIEHPFEKDLGFLYGIIFTGPPGDRAAHSRHVCVFADGEVDRSPTGTGVSGRLAILERRGELAAGDTVKIESILGTQFSGRIVGSQNFGGYEAVIPEIGGSAYITGRHEFIIDPRDPLCEGFLLNRDHSHLSYKG